MFTGRSLNSSVKLGDKISDAERKQIREQFKDINVPQVVAFLESLPREILLASRINNLVRGIYQELGGSQVDRFVDNATFAILGTYTIPQVERERIVHARVQYMVKFNRKLEKLPPSWFVGLWGPSSLLWRHWDLTHDIPTLYSRLHFWSDILLMRVRVWVADTVFALLSLLRVIQPL